MTGVATPADRHFRRARVKPARRRPWRTRLLPVLKTGVVIALAVYAIYRGEAIVAHARVLQIDRIVVRGNERLSTGEVLAMLDPMLGESLVRSDLESWRRRLLASSWVRDASLRRSLPSTVEVALTERQPIGIGRSNGALRLIDEHGVSIDDYGPQYANFDLPIVDGLGSGASDGLQADAARAGLAARIIAALKTDAEIGRRLSQVDVSDPHNGAVMLSGDSALVYVGEDRFLPRLQSYLDLAAALRERVTDIDYVDLRFEDRMYVRPAGRTEKNGGVPRKRVKAGPQRE